MIYRLAAAGGQSDPATEERTARTDPLPPPPPREQLEQNLPPPGMRVNPSYVGGGGVNICPHDPLVSTLPI
jgi:hypothetical protein